MQRNTFSVIKNTAQHGNVILQRNNKKTMFLNKWYFDTVAFTSLRMLVPSFKIQKTSEFDDTFWKSAIQHAQTAPHCIITGLKCFRHSSKLGILQVNYLSNNKGLTYLFSRSLDSKTKCMCAHYFHLMKERTRSKRMVAGDYTLTADSRWSLIDDHISLFFI